MTRIVISIESGCLAGVSIESDNPEELSMVLVDYDAEGTGHQIHGTDVYLMTIDPEEDAVFVRDVFEKLEES